MSKEKVVVINDFWATVGRLTLNFAEPRVEEALPDGSLPEEFFLSTMPPARQTLIVLNDKDPANAEQMRQVWIEDWFRTKLRPILKKRADALVEKAKNKDIRAVAMAFVAILNDILGVISDDIDGDAEQIEAYFAEYLKDEAFRDLVIENVVVAFLRFLKADEGVVSLFREIFLELWKAYVGGTAFTLTLNELVARAQH